MKNNKKIIVVLFALCMGNFLQAKVRAIVTRRDFENAVANGRMVVALFYESDKAHNASRNQTKGLNRMYSDLSDRQAYDDADLEFLKVNIKRPDLAELAQLYNVKKVPTFIFFNNGKRLLNKNSDPLELQGFVSQVDLQKSIDTYYGKEIQQYVADKEARRRELIAEESEAWKYYFYPRYMVSPNYSPMESRKNLE